MIRKLILLCMAFMLTACSNQSEKLTISATTWVGYSPLYYAKAKGWLEPLNIKLLHVSSLSENMYLYEAGNADAYVGTQYEYSVMSPQKPTLNPIMMFDRSNGGDLLLSNQSIAELQKTPEKINVYLEMDSINRTLLNDFITKYGLDKDHLNLINQDQASISNINFQKILGPTIIVTYTPYNIGLEKKGFQEIASTGDGLDLLVVDALFSTKDIANIHRAQLKALKKMVAKAVNDLQKNPKEFYDTIKPYMLELSYEEFTHSLNDIVWINDSLSKPLIQRLKQAKFPTDELL